MQAETMKKKPNVLSGKQVFDLYGWIDHHRDMVAGQTDSATAYDASSDLGFPVTENNIYSARVELGIAKNKPKDIVAISLDGIAASVVEVVQIVADLKRQIIDLKKDTDDISAKSKIIMARIGIGNRNESLFLADNGTSTKA